MCVESSLAAELTPEGRTVSKMPRPHRAFVDGLFHLAVHASDTRSLYVTDDDRIRFLVLLTTVFGRHELTPIAYTLMGNHYHVVLHVPDARMSQAMQQLHTNYSRRQNFLHRRSAHLFRAHFSATHITTDRHFIGAIRYLARNPVEAGLVMNALDWEWSSARAHAGVESPVIPLDETPLRSAFDDRPDWRLQYQRLVSDV
jgi:REP-associated tyrosine transposase